jgi:hypothetical protein
MRRLNRHYQGADNEFKEGFQHARSAAATASYPYLQPG